MSKIPILILHGWNLNATKFLPLQTELNKRGYDVFCPDLPGFGNTQIPKNPLKLSDYVKFVVSFIKQKKINRIVLIGHSFGGRIGIKLAADFPQYLHAVILTGAPGFTPVPRLKILFFIFLAKIGRIIFNFPILSFFQNVSRKFLYKIAKASDFYNTDENMRDTFKNIISESLKEYLLKIRIPTLLLWGANDKIVPLYIAKRMEKYIKNTQLKVIPYARHGLPWTHPNIFVDHMEIFLKKI